MITFITENEPEKDLMFGQVAANQFFVNKEGWLMQKVNANSAITIADYLKAPFARCSVEFAKGERIKKILPHVKRIEF